MKPLSLLQTLERRNPITLEQVQQLDRKKPGCLEETKYSGQAALHLAVERQYPVDSIRFLASRSSSKKYPMDDAIGQRHASVHVATPTKHLVPAQRKKDMLHRLYGPPKPTPVQDRPDIV
jgi:hypothetical protein